MTLRYLSAIAIAIIYLLFCWICWLKHRQRSRAPDVIAVANDHTQTPILIGYASQTGNAELIAARSAEQLQQAGMAVKLLPLNKIDQSLLAGSRQVLFVVSTYGEGEPPDNGASFLRRYLASQSLNLSHLQFGILALGDSDYRHFCGFGHALNHALHHQQAKSVFDMIEVDKNDESALRHWQYYLGQLTGKTHFTDWQKPAYRQWYLHGRHCLNPGSPGNPAYHLQLTPAEGETWCAGDIAEIGPRNAAVRIEAFIATVFADTHASEREKLIHLLSRRQLPINELEMQAIRELTFEQILQQLPELPHREYSIASLPQDGTLDLLVRQQRQPHGELGIGSGWLTEYAQTGDEIALRIRTNTSFHPPSADVPLVLIGNGTGLAGLRAHLRARAQAGQRRNWLIFGERTRAHDFFFADEILRWQETGHLQELDLVFSRDQLQVRYVQDLLAEKSGQLLAWVNAGAAVYVCGSLQGMAQGVDEVLTHLLGAEATEQLTDSGRYRRDVY